VFGAAVAPGDGGCRFSAGDLVSICVMLALMSASGTKRTCLPRRLMSAFEGKADMAQGRRDVSL
jgi:hypothetical protein